MRLTSPVLENMTMEKYFSQEFYHPNISFRRGKKWYQDFKNKQPSYPPIELCYNGQHWGDFDWKKLHIYLDATGDHNERLQELVRHLLRVAFGEVTYSHVITYVEICCFVPRERRYSILNTLRHASEHFCINKSEKKVDKSYNGVSEIFLSGLLQMKSEEPIFRLKLYEAIQEPPLGFKDRGTPKLEMQIEGEFDDWEEPQQFGMQMIVPLLHHHQANTFSAREVCLDKDGGSGYLPLSIPEDIEGQGNHYIHELLAYSQYAQHPEWLRGDPRYYFFEQIYLNGRRSKTELIHAGIGQYDIRKAEQERMILACKRKGRGGNSYRVNFLYRED